mgnify:CR=1 FL=1
MDGDFYQRVYDIVRQIPEGKIATYGQIAWITGSPYAARTVGYALHALKEGQVTPAVPWHRVINARGTISLPRGGGYELQREMLAAEGVLPDGNDVYDFRKYRWVISDERPDECDF